MEANLTDFQFLYIDLFLLTTLSVTCKYITQTKVSGIANMENITIYVVNIWVWFFKTNDVVS